MESRAFTGGERGDAPGGVRLGASRAAAAAAGLSTAAPSQVLAPVSAVSPGVVPRRVADVDTPAAPPGDATPAPPGDAPATPPVDAPPAPLDDVAPAAIPRLGSPPALSTSDEPAEGATRFVATRAEAQRFRGDAADFAWIFETARSRSAEELVRAPRLGFDRGRAARGARGPAAVASTRRGQRRLRSLDSAER